MGMLVSYHSVWMLTGLAEIVCSRVVGGLILASRIMLPTGL